MSRPTLPADVLTRRDELPTKPAPVVLTGSLVELRPVALDSDVEALHAVSSGAPCRLAGRTVESYDPDARVWRYMSGGPFADPAALRGWLAPLAAGGDSLALAVRMAGALVGVACYLANHPEYLKIELGAIWYGPIAQGTGCAAEAAYLMLDHAFALGYRRVEWKCDTDNQPSRRAAIAYGFAFEGVQDAHYIVKQRNRDTAWFRMLDHEWPVIAPRLRAYAAARAIR